MSTPHGNTSTHHVYAGTDLRHLIRERSGCTLPQSSRQAGGESQPLPALASGFECRSRAAEPGGCPDVSHRPCCLPDQPSVPRETCSCALTSRQFRAGPLRHGPVDRPQQPKVESPRLEPDAYPVNQRANPSTVVPMPIRSRGSCHNPEVVSNSLSTRTSRTPPTYP